MAFKGPRRLDGKANPDYQKYRRSRRRQWIGKIKTRLGCEKCGYDENPLALEFDHLDNRDKSFTISSGQLTRSLSSIFSEIRKCRVLCSNCHKITSFKRKHYYNH